MVLATSMRRETVLFGGWFGPRGLASIAYGLVILDEEPGLRGVRKIVLVMVVTVVISVFAHGATAAPIGARYGRWSKQLPPDAPEFGRGAEHPTQLAFVDPTRKADSAKSPDADDARPPGVRHRRVCAPNDAHRVLLLAQVRPPR
jgi:hypothetical protein